MRFRLNLNPRAYAQFQGDTPALRLLTDSSCLLAHAQQHLSSLVFLYQRSVSLLALMQGILTSSFLLGTLQ